MAKFSLGQVVATKGVLAKVSNEEIMKALSRHQQGDWGESQDKKMNDEAVKNGDDRILSVYRSRDGVKFYIITEWDRSATTVLLPEEY